MKEGFEPSPLRTSALSWRLRPLGHLTFVAVLANLLPQIGPTLLTLALTRERQGRVGQGCGYLFARKQPFFFFKINQNKGNTINIFRLSRRRNPK